MSLCLTIRIGEGPLVKIGDAIVSVERPPGMAQGAVRLRIDAPKHIAITRIFDQELREVECPGCGGKAHLLNVIHETDRIGHKIACDSGCKSPVGKVKVWERWDRILPAAP